MSNEVPCRHLLSHLYPTVGWGGKFKKQRTKVKDNDDSNNSTERGNNKEKGGARERAIKLSDEHNHCSAHADWCPVWPAAETGTSPVCTLSTMLRARKYSFGHFGSAVLALPPPKLLCTSLVAEQGKPRSPWLKLSTTEQQLKHRCGINIILILSPTYNTVATTRKKINSIPVKTRTPYYFPIQESNSSSKSELTHCTSSSVAPLSNI